MNDYLLDYLNDLAKNTSQTMGEEQLVTHEEAFTHYVLSQISTKVASSNYVVCHACIKNSIGSILGEIHGYNESQNKEVLTLFYTIYNNSVKEVKTLSDSDTQFVWSRLQGFYEKSIRAAYFDMDETNPAYEVCKMIDENKHNYKVVRFYLLSNCAIPKSQPKKIRIRNKETDVNTWDLIKLQGNLTDTSDHVRIDIDFINDADYDYQIPYIQMESDKHNEYKCLMMMFPAKLLYKLYKKWNTDLLLYNVRYWLTFKKTKRKHANADIRDTLRNAPQMFLAYNNGITAICSEVELAPHGTATMVSDSESVSKDMVTSGIMKAIRNFQIVNGGQTTASIFRAKDAESAIIDLSGVFVQIKLIVIGPNQSVNELAGKISRCSNTQNAVKDSEFSVSEQFNTKMQELSRSILIPSDRGDLSYWYYNRIGGQFEEEKAKITRKDAAAAFMLKYPKKYHFTKEIMAIVRTAWAEEPGDAVKGAGTAYDLFISKIISDGIVPDETYYKETIALLIIYNYLKSRKENKNYGNGKAPVIAYTLAYLHYITFEDLSLIDIWEAQNLTEKQQEGLDMIAEKIFELLNSMAIEDGTSILSLSKRKGVFNDIVQKMNGEDISSLRSHFL